MSPTSADEDDDDDDNPGESKLEALTPNAVVISLLSLLISFAGEHCCDPALFGDLWSCCCSSSSALDAHTPMISSSDDPRRVVDCLCVCLLGLPTTPNLSNSSLLIVDLKLHITQLHRLKHNSILKGVPF
jgi:hypothetical protein